MYLNKINDYMQYSIKNQTQVDLYFYGDIVSQDIYAEDEDQSPESVKNFLDSVKGKSLNIYINSGGGSVFGGMAIYNMLKRHNGYKTVYVDGLAASISSVIALAGDEIIIPSNSYFMIHKPWTRISGDADKMRKIATDLDALEGGILEVYKNNLKPGVSMEKIKQMVNEETWLTGEEAAKYFNVEVASAYDTVAYTNRRYNNAPKNLRVSSQPISSEMKLMLAKAQLYLLRLKVKEI